MKKDFKNWLTAYLIAVGIGILFSIIALLCFPCHKHHQPQHIYIDSTQVRVVYTDTWGKIFIMKEEDL